MCGDIELTAMHRKHACEEILTANSSTFFYSDSSESASSDSCLSTCNSVQFFPVISIFYPISKRLALAKKVCGFIEQTILKESRCHQNTPVLMTIFCDVNEEPSPPLGLYIFLLLELMSDEYVLENILVDMLIYIDFYFKHQHNDWLHHANIKTLILCSTWLATAILEDKELDYQALLTFSGFTREHLNRLQVRFFECIGWNFYIGAEMHQMCSKALDDYTIRSSRVSSPSVDYDENDANNFAL